MTAKSTHAVRLCDSDDPFISLVFGSVENARDMARKFEELNPTITLKKYDWPIEIENTGRME
jgi:hypothetical protein